MRVGWGFDAHRFGAEPPLRLCGVVVDDDRGLAATSDGDVAAHAVADALLGAAALGDLGMHFPGDESTGADSMNLLAQVVRMVADHGWEVAQVDLTIVAQDVRVAPHRAAMRRRLAEVLHTPIAEVSVKATTTDEMGWLGRAEGIGAAAVAVINR